VPIVFKPGNLNILEYSELAHACNEMDVPLPLYGKKEMILIFIRVWQSLLPTTTFILEFV